MSDNELTPSGGAQITAVDLHKHFRVKVGREQKLLRAVDGVNLTIAPGETLGIVGESGCGKSTLARVIVGLLEPTSGTVSVSDKVVWGPGKSYSRNGGLQMVFQNPAGSLNPRMTIGACIAEPLRARGEKNVDDKVREMLGLVGLKADYLKALPHELSGGQQQRAAIARALISEPNLVVHDEAVSSLDISLQAQILNLLLELQERLGISYMFISHDLAAVQAISHRVAVMYLGEIVEEAPTDAFRRNPLHPYSAALRRSALLPDPAVERTRADAVMAGELPSPLNPPSGCRFRTRCPFAQERCAQERPVLRDMGNGQRVACHFVGTPTIPSAYEGVSA